MGSGNIRGLPGQCNLINQYIDQLINQLTVEFFSTKALFLEFEVKKKQHFGSVLNHMPNSYNIRD